MTALPPGELDQPVSGRRLPRCSTRRATVLVVAGYALGGLAGLVGGIAGLCGIGGSEACTTGDRVTVSGGAIVLVAGWVGTPLLAALLTRRVRWVALPSVLIAALVAYQRVEAARSAHTAAVFERERVTATQLAQLADQLVAWPAIPPLGPNATLATRVAWLRRLQKAQAAAIAAAAPGLAARQVSVVNPGPPQASLRFHGQLYCLYGPRTPLRTAVLVGACPPAS